MMARPKSPEIRDKVENSGMYYSRFKKALIRPNEPENYTHVIKKMSILFGRDVSSIKRWFQLGVPHYVTVVLDLLEAISPQKRLDISNRISFIIDEEMSSCDDK
jgi:hypothetical protein